MATRATITISTTVLNRKSTTRFYHHYDGYPSWLGKQIALSLVQFEEDQRKRWNYLGRRESNVSSGMVCILKHLFENLPSVEITGDGILPQEEYNYHIEIFPDHTNKFSGFGYKVTITNENYTKEETELECIFSGDLQTYLIYIAKEVHKSNKYFVEYYGKYAKDGGLVTPDDVMEVVEQIAKPEFICPTYPMTRCRNPYDMIFKHRD